MDAQLRSSHGQPSMAAKVRAARIILEAFARQGMIDGWDDGVGITGMTQAWEEPYPPKGGQDGGEIRRGATAL